MAACARPWNRADLLNDLAHLWAGPGHTLACLSVRTGFDILLQALTLPPGSEVVITALTIPDMVTIVQRHGLVPVPVDISPVTLAPTPEALERCLTPRTRIVVLTHLFGTHIPVEPIRQALQSRDILVVEDSAQAFDGSENGHPAADVSMFSFGPIKTATALGGALFRVKDPALLRRLQQLQDALPCQTRGEYLRRVCKYALIRFASGPTVWGGIAWICRQRGIDYDPAVTRTARGFAGPGDFLSRIRRQPSTPLLAVLRRRLNRFDAAALARRRMHGQRLASLLQSHFSLPGASAPTNSYWLFPLLSSRRTELISRLREAGFDAAQHHTLGVVPLPQSAPWGTNAQALLAQLLFLPAGAHLPDREIERLGETLRSLAERSEGA
jgi:dTDP-4-amino-4,6-dideoxygalactose transaminase